MTPTARSIMLPRATKSRNPFSIVPPSHSMLRKQRARPVYFWSLFRTPRFGGKKKGRFRAPSSTLRNVTSFSFRRHESRWPTSCRLSCRPCNGPWAFFEISALDLGFVVPVDRGILPVSSLDHHHLSRH